MNGRDGLTERERWERIDAEAMRLDALHDEAREATVVQVTKPKELTTSQRLKNLGWRKVNGVWTAPKRKWPKAKAWYSWEPPKRVKFVRKHVSRRGPFDLPKKVRSPFMTTATGEVGVVAAAVAGVGTGFAAAYHATDDDYPYGP